MAQCRQLSMRPRLMTSLEPAAPVSASTVDNHSPSLCQPSSVPTRRRWLVWNNVPSTASTECLDPDLLSPGCMSSRDITPSPAVCWATQSTSSTLDKSLFSTGNSQTMTSSSSAEEQKSGTSRSFLQFCRKQSKLSSSICEEQTEDNSCPDDQTFNNDVTARDIDTQPSDLLTPMSAESLLVATPSRDQVELPAPGASEVRARCNISVIDEEMTTTTTDPNDLTSSDRYSSVAAAAAAPLFTGLLCCVLPTAIRPNAQ